MPLGKTYSKNERKWINKETEQRIDYTLLDVDAWGLLLSFFRAYPDYLLDALESKNPQYRLEPLQRVMIRALFQYKDVFITGCRGTTKTYCILLSRLLMGILFPGVIMQYFAPALKQAAQIVSPVYRDIQNQYPALCEYWNIVSDAKDNFVLETKHGSVFSITAVRGGTYNSIIAEESAQEETGKQFDFEAYEAVLPAVRKKRMINAQADPNFINFQHHYITSAGRQQNRAFDFRSDIVKRTRNGDDAFFMDIPVAAVLLSQIRDIGWYHDQKRTLTAEKQLRELESFWTGTSENPVVRDSVLSESKNLAVMEDRHCGDDDVIYIIGYDVSYADGAGNAKCAYAALKCEKQSKNNKRDRYLKSFVYLDDNPPPRDAVTQARQLKRFWYRYCLENGAPTYISIDANSYGKSVLEHLHKDLDDGLPPLCCIDHDYRELEIDGALPVIYPIVATGGISGAHDSDGEMLRYAELEFENRNVRMLVSNINEGVDAYKKAHRIKDDDGDVSISKPYIKTRELCGQISNLKKKVSGINLREERISQHIQRDMWSASKYALRLAQIIEKRELVESLKKKSAWHELALKATTSVLPQTAGLPQRQIQPKTRTIGYNGGNKIR